MIDKEDSMFESHIILSVVITNQMNMLKKYHGKYFTATIEGVETQGRINAEQINEDPPFLYLCQNDVNGFRCIDKFGYKYSWAVDPDSIKNGGDSCNGVQNLIVKRKVSYEM